MRLVRAGMIEVLGSDYVRTARAKGLSGASVVFKHALRNALVPWWRWPPCSSASCSAARW